MYSLVTPFYFFRILAPAHLVICLRAESQTTCHPVDELRALRSCELHVHNASTRWRRYPRPPSATVGCSLSLRSAAPSVIHTLQNMFLYDARELRMWAIRLDWGRGARRRGRCCGGGLLHCGARRNTAAPVFQITSKASLDSHCAVMLGP